MENLENLENEIVSFKEAFCPYGYLDIRTAVEQAVEAGFDGDWAFDQIERFCEECGMKVSDIDPCYVVMDSILQQARNEIGSLSGFDVCNDANFLVHGNFMCSSFECTEEDCEGLRSALLSFERELGELSVCARYWLNENGIELGGIGNVGDR